VSGDLRLGLAGCGRLAERGYLPALELARGVRLVAVADPTPERCRRIAPGAAAFETAEELLADGGVDALVLATPPGAHLADARLAAAAGVPVLVEKPPGLDAREAAELAALDPEPFVGLNRRFEPALVRLRERLPERGRVRLDLTLEAQREAWAPYVASADALLDLGPHLVDLAGWLTGSAVKRVRTSHLDPVRASLELETEKGIALVSLAHDRPWLESFALRDERGRLLARHVAGGLAGRMRARLARRQVLAVSLAAQLEAFARAVQGGSGGQLATARDGLAVMTVLDAARSSGEHGAAWMPVDGAAG
jgi:myo-inositol 2-dehydrogenase/D-chiro-inositol 1-dehydrogenase